MGRRMVLLALVALIMLAAGSVAHAAGPNAIMQLEGCDTNVLGPNDDSFTGFVSLPFPLEFGGTTYSTACINNNGNVTFDACQATFTPFPLINTSRVIIAPFFGDVDTRGDGSALVTYGDAMVGDRRAFCVMWDSVGVGYYSGHTNKLNMFQLLLVDRSDRPTGGFDVVFNYDQVQWETGDASGGVDGLGGFSARAGLSNGSTFSLELPGSGVNGAFLDSSPTGLIYNNLNSPSQPGRYIIPVPGGSEPPIGRIDGTVTDPGDNPVAGALVQVCPTDGERCVSVTSTNSLGAYTASNIPDGDFVVRAFPPAESILIPAQIDVTVSGQEHIVGADIQLGGPVPPPAGTGISPSSPGGGGVPVIYWTNTTTVTTTGCQGGTASYEVVLDGSTTPIASGPMAEVPSGSGHYSATVPPFFPRHGSAVVHIQIVCPSGPTIVIQFPIYIDPSGVVQTPGGAPVAGATVTLFRSDTGAPGTFEPVPDGSAIMSPSNRNNPMVTNEFGQFGWDVISGFYIVHAQKDGCTPDTGVDSDILTIPPAVTGVVLTLTCPRMLTALSPAMVWVGLKNSDDVGTYVDLKADVYHDGVLIKSNMANGVSGGSSGFNNARLSLINLTLPAPVLLPAPTVLSVRLSARISCAHATHAAGTPRLWFNDAQASSRFGATIDGVSTTYYLHGGSALGTTAGAGPKMSVDVPLNSKVACSAPGGRPFTSFGTWSITLP